MLTTSVKKFFEGSQAMTSVTTTGLTSSVVQIQDIFSTPDGAIIKDSENSVLGKPYAIQLLFDGAVAGSTLSVQVYTQSDASNTTCTKQIATFGPYTVDEMNDGEIIIPITGKGICGSLKLTLVATGTFTAGNLTGALFTPVG